MKKLNIGFAGTPSFGLHALQALHESHHTLKAIYTQPDRPAGRGRKLQASPIKEFATAHHIALFQPLNFKQDEDVETLRSLELDVLVVIAYGLILPTRVLETPRYGCINVHASLLPRWRGASPIQQSLLHGDSKTGVTIMQMDKGLDTGDMLCLESIAIEATDTSETLHDKLAKLAVEPLLQTLEAIANSTAHRTPQEKEGATYAPKITKEEAHLDWSQKLEVIDRKIRAYQPWPVAYTYLQNDLVRIHQAKKTEKTTDAKPGTMIELNKTGIFVATQDGVLQITSLQSPGGKVLPTHAWLQSHPTLQVGMSFT